MLNNNTETSKVDSSGEPRLSSGTVSFTACVTAILVSVILHPLDVIKTRMQVSKISGGAVPVYTSSFSACHKILVNEGWQGLYKGLFASVLATGVSWGLFRYLYETIFRSLEKSDSFLSKSLLSLFTQSETTAEASPMLSSFSASFIAAFLGGTMSTCLVHPLWLIKTRLELQTPEAKAAHWVQYNGWFDSLCSIFMKERLTGLYKGLWFAMNEYNFKLLGLIPALGLVSQGGLQLVLYEEIKRYSKRNAKRNVWSTLLNTVPPTLAPFLWGAASKFLVVTATYPLQVFRTRLQIAPKVLSRTNQLILVKNSISSKQFRQGLYGGYATYIQRACLYSGLHYLFFEYLLSLKHNLKFQL